MRKPWVFKRSDGKPGWYVGWYDDESTRRKKRMPNKRVAEDYAARLQHELNADLYSQPVSISWDELTTRFIEQKRDIEGLSDESIRQYQGTFETFKDLVGPIPSAKFRQEHANAFIKARKVPGKRKDGTPYCTSMATINKDLRHLRALVRWAIGSRLMGEPARRIQWYKQKEVKKPVRALNAEQLASVIATAKRLYGMPWVIRILLSLGSGLRQEDVEHIQIKDIYQEDNTIASRSKKSNKVYAYRPVHPSIIRAVTSYAEGLTSKTLFPDKYHHSKWERIRRIASVEGYKYHDLRRSFSSFLAQAGYSTAVIQDLLEHSSPETTKGYVQTKPVHREAVDSIPIDEIMRSALR